MSTVPATIEKRVVVHVVTGRRAGLRKIIGHLIFNAGSELPMKFQNVHICKGEPGRDVFRAGDYPNYVLYREQTPGKPQPRAPRKAKVIVDDGRTAS